MHTKRLRVFILFLAPILLSTTCEQKKCPEDTICTMMFAAVSLEVLDAGNSPAVLDEVYTMRVGTNETIRPQQHGQNGQYVVLDDSYQKKLANAADTFYLVGMKNGQKVVNEPLVIGADCCHVRKVSGKTQVVLP